MSEVITATIYTKPVKLLNKNNISNDEWKSKWMNILNIKDIIFSSLLSYNDENDVYFISTTNEYVEQFGTLLTNNFVLHRKQGPAVKYSNGSKLYFHEGKLHNENGPAIISHDGSVEYYINGELHREDGPARTSPDGTMEYRINGKLHNLHGPAYISPDTGVFKFYVNGELHNESGPAWICPTSKTYWINGKYIKYER